MTADNDILDDLIENFKENFPAGALEEPNRPAARVKATSDEVDVFMQTFPFLQAFEDAVASVRKPVNVCLTSELPVPGATPTNTL